MKHLILFLLLTFLPVLGDSQVRGSLSCGATRGGSRANFCLKPTDVSGLTAFWDSTSQANMTLTATRQASQLNDLSGNNYHLTQATAGNQPYLSRSDNRENQALYSTTVGGTGWTNRGLTVTANAAENPIDGTVDAIKLLETNTTAYHDTYITTAVTRTIAGATYDVSVYAKQGNGTRKFWIRAQGGLNVNVGYDLDAGTVLGSPYGSPASTYIQSVGDGWYRCGFTKTEDTTAATDLQLVIDAIASYAGDGTSYIYVYGGQIRSTSADSTYIPTTTYPQYRGINGNTALVFDGVDDVLTSTATFANLFGAQAKTVVMAIKPNVLNATQVIFGDAHTDTTQYLNIRIKSTGSVIQAFNLDSGGLDYIEKATTTNPQVVTLTHDTTNLNFYVDGVSAAAPVASGATTTMTDTITVGGLTTASQLFNGYIAAIAVYNRALSSDERIRVEQYFRRKYGTS